MNFSLRKYHALKIKMHKTDCLIKNCKCEYIQQNSTIKYLGLMIDQDLKWKSHINYIVKSLSKIQNVFSKY